MSVTDFGQCKLCRHIAPEICTLLRHVHTWLLVPVVHIPTRSVCVGADYSAPQLGIITCQVLPSDAMPFGGFLQCILGRNELCRDLWELEVKFSACNFLYSIMKSITHIFTSLFKNLRSTYQCPPLLTEAWNPQMCALFF